MHGSLSQVWYERRPCLSRVGMTALTLCGSRSIVRFPNFCEGASDVLCFIRELILLSFFLRNVDITRTFESLNARGSLGQQIFPHKFFRKRRKKLIGRSHSDLASSWKLFLTPETNDRKKQTIDRSVTPAHKRTLFAVFNRNSFKEESKQNLWPGL